jgi:hypothetical protein
METQQQDLSVLSARKVSAILSSQNKSKTLVSMSSGNSNIHSYNKWLVQNRFALCTARRYVTQGS